MQKNIQAVPLRSAGREQWAMALAASLLSALCWTHAAAADTTIVTQPGNIETTVVDTNTINSQTQIVTTPVGTTSSTTVVTTPAPAATATIIAEPNEVILESLEKPVTITLNTDGGPVTAADIRAARLLVDGQVYNDNVNIQVVDGKVTLVPTRDLPPGRYTLLVDTARGQTEVLVYNPTPNYPRTISRQATIIGITEPELEVTLGRTLATPAKTIALNLKPVYYQGQTIMADMDVDATHHYSWRVNGKEVKYGQGDHTFVYTFKEPGNNVVTYTERDGDLVVASGIESVDIVGRPVLVRRIVPGKEVSLTGPEGYSEYTWKVDGKTVATGQTLTHVFPADGSHRVEVIAEDPKDTAADEYRAMTYEFIVNAQ